MPPRRRRPPVQLTLPGEIANDDGIEAFLGEPTPTGERTIAPSTPSELRERAGRRAKRLGDELERWVGSYLATAVRAGALAWWMKVHPGVVHRRALIDGRWGFKLAWGERAAADFVGLLPDGRMLAIECKSIEGQRLPRRAIQPQQLAHLGAVSTTGGVALLAAEFRDEGAAGYAARQYVIPWHLVPWVTARTAESLTELDATPWRERRGEFLARLRGE